MTTLAQIASNQAQKEVTANGNFTAVAAAGLFGNKYSTTVGLVWGYYGGFLPSLTAVPDGTVTLTNAALNYVQANTVTGAVTANTTGWTAGLFPLYTVTTAGGIITAYSDCRAIVPIGYASLAMTNTWTGIQTFSGAGNPVITNFAGMNHTHASAAQGGQLTLATALSDVVISAPAVDDRLKWSGSAWINGPGTVVSAGIAISFYNDSAVITASGTQNAISLETLTAVPSGTGQVADAVAVNNSTAAINAYLSGVLGRTVLDAGVWTMNIWAGVDSITGGRISTITEDIYRVIVEAVNTVTTTGTGTTRTCTMSAGTPYAAGDANADVTLCGYVQTPKGLYPISAYTSPTVVSISVPAGYVNEAAVAASTWKYLFKATTPAIVDISPNYGLDTVQSTQGSFSFGVNDKLGSITFGTSNNTTTITYVHNGTTKASRIDSPLSTLHNNLGGLQGGIGGQYYHLAWNGTVGVYSPTNLAIGADALGTLSAGAIQINGATSGSCSITINATSTTVSLDKALSLGTNELTAGPFTSKPVSATADAAVLSTSGKTTGSAWINLSNTSGAAIFGVSGSAAGGVVGGAAPNSAYATVITAPSGRNVEIGISGGLGIMATFSSAGLAVTGVGTYTQGITSGSAGGTLGSLALKGTTSGTATMTVDATAATVSLDKALTLTGALTSTGDYTQSQGTTSQIKLLNTRAGASYARLHWADNGASSNSIWDVDPGSTGSGTPYASIRVRGVEMFNATPTLLQLSIATRMAAATTFSLGVFTFATLPTPAVSMMAYVSDSNTATWGATIAGGGANKVLAWHDGTNWTVVGK